MKLLSARYRRFWRIQFCIIFAILVLSSAAGANSVWIESGPGGWYNRTYANFTYNSSDTGDIYYVTVGSYSSFLADKYYNAATLTDKNYTFSVKAYNGTAWVGPAERKFWVDLTPPTVNITKGPGAWLNSSAAAFEWMGYDSRSGIAGYYYWLDSESPVYTNNTSVTLINIGNGSHVFKVKAIDRASLESAAASYNFGINTDLPVVSITSGHGGWTNIAAPAFTWTGTAFNSTIFGYYYRWDSVPQNTTADTTITLPQLPDGTHTFYIQAVDADMRVGDVVSRNFSIDTVKPNAAITSGPNGWINTSIFTFSWNGSDDRSGILGYYYWLNNESQTFTTSTNVTLSRADGSYIFYIKPVDAAGNIEYAVNRSFGIDTGAPYTEIVYGPSGWINQKNATFDWASSSASGISGYYYWMDNGSKTFTVNTSVTINYIPDGSHTFSVQAYNLLNVSSNIAGRSFSVDTVPPSAPAVSESHSGGNATPWPVWSSHDTPYFTWPDSIDIGSGVASFRARKNGEAWIEVTSGYHPVLGTGQYMFEFWAVDRVGNQGNKSVIYLRIDTTPPGAWFTSAPSWFNTTTNLTFKWDGSDNESDISGYYYSVDNSTEVFTTSKNITIGSISAGSHILYLKPIDNAGNNGSRISRNFGVDVISPTVNIISNQSGWLNSGTQTFTWAGTDDFSGIKGYYYWIDNGTRIYTEFTSATVFMGDGTHTFHVQALDNAGNMGSGDSVMFSIDTTPPPAPVVSETHSNGSSFPNPAWSSHDTPYFMWNTSNDALEGIEYYQASIDSSPWFNVTTPYHPTIGTGSLFFDFRAVDRVGLASIITRMYVRIDTIPPALSITSGPGGWTNNSVPAFAWNGSDAHSGTAGYYYSIDNGTETFTALPNATLKPLSDGEHIFSIKAVDNVGLLSANVSRTFLVDTIPPSVPAVSESHSNGSSTPNPPWSSHDTPLFDWIESTDIGSGIGYYEARLNNSTWIKLAAKPWHPALPSGAHSIDFRAVDNVTNPGNFTTLYLRIDTVAPKINNLSGPSDWTNSTSPTFAWNGSDNESGIVGYYYSIDNGAETFTLNTSITLPYMAAENHTFSLRAVDNVSLSSSPVMREFWIDAGMPNVAITAGPSGWTKIAAPTFAWNGSDNLSGVKGYYYSIDNTPWVYTSSTYTTLPAQGNGNHSFYVRAKDNAGNIGDSDSRAFIIDTVPPVLNITDEPSGWTNNSSPVFAWNASDNGSGIAGYYYSTDSSPEIFTVLPNATLANLSEGAHIFRVTAVDNAGVNSTASRSFSVDVSPPTVNITYNPGAETKNKTPLFIWSGADSLSGLKGYYYSYDNSSEIFTLATNATLPSLPDGNHIFRVRAVDMVWISSVYDAWSFTLNTVPPTVPVVSESHSNGSSTPNPPWSTHDTPYFTWPDSIDDMGSPVYYELSINNGTWAAVASPYHPTMTTGSYVFRFRAVDSFGNPSDAYPVYVRIDTVPPSVSIISSPSGWTNETTLTFAWLGTDIGSGISGYYYNFDGGPDTYTPLSTLNIPTLPDGAHTFNIRAVDNVGFESAAASRNFSTDTNVPSVWLEEMPGMWTNNSTPFFAWDSTDGAGSGVAGYRYWIDAAPEAYTVNNSIELSYLPDGAHIFNIVAVDRVGWESPVLQYTFNIDTEGPGLFIVIESHSNGFSTPNPPWSTHNTPYFNWSAPTDVGSGLSHYEASVNNGTWQTVSSPWHPSISSGNYTFRFRGVDSVGNTGLIYTLYVRIDIDNPAVSSISGPSGWISTNNDALNPYKQNITWQALDNESGIAGYFYKFDSSSEIHTTLASTALPSLPDGAHTFSIRAIDNVGLTSAYSSINFSLDTAKPDKPVVSETHSNGSSSPNPPWSVHESPYFTWSTVSDIGSSVSYYQVRKNNGTWTNATSPHHPVMTTGNYTFDFRSVDAATNPSDYYRIYVRIDLDDPTISIPAASVYSTSGSVTYTTNPSDVGSGVKDVYMEIADETGNIIFNGWIGASGEYIYNSMSPGMSYKARAYAVDNAGRTSAWSAWSALTMYDPWDPTVTQPNITTPTYGGGAYFRFVNATQTSITFNFSAADQGSGVDYINFELKSSPVPDLLSGPNKTLVFSGRANGIYTISPPLSATGYIARAEAFDKAGRRSGWSGNTTVIYDNVFPTLVVDNTSKYIRGNTAIITGSASDDTPLFGNPYVYAEINDNGNISYAPAIPGVNNNFTIQINNVTTATTAKVIAIDMAGNKVEKTVLFYKDNDPPIITLIAPVNGFWTGEKKIRVYGTVYDNYEMDYLSVNDQNANLTGSNWFRPAVLNWSIDMELFEGRNTFYIRAKDVAGNFANTSVYVYADYSSPILDILSPEDGAVIEYPSTIISGVAWDNTGVTGVYVNGNLATGIFGRELQAVDWYYNVPLSFGSNTFTVTAVDDQDNRVSKNITIIRQSGTPSIQITNLMIGDRVGTEYIDVNGTAYDTDGISQIKIDVTHIIPGSESKLIGSYVLYPSNIFCSNASTNATNLTDIIDWLFPPKNSVCQQAVGNATNKTATGVLSWNNNIKLEIGMNIIEARVYDIGGLTSSTSLYVVYADVPVIAINTPPRRVSKTSAAGILASGTARTNKTTITNISLRIYDSDGVTVDDADIVRLSNTSVQWSYPVAMMRFGTFAVEFRAYIEDGDYSKKEFIINRIPANFTGEYAYPETQGRYARYNFTSNNTIDYYDFVKESPDNGATQNYIIHEYLDWGEGWWKIKDNQTLSLGVKDNSGEVAGLPNYSWPVKKMLDYNLTWVAHTRWDYQETPPDDEGYENMIGWFKDRPPQNYPPYVSIGMLADLTDSSLPWYTGNLTQHGWVSANPSVWDWNRYYEPQFPEPLKLDWTLDGRAVPPQVYVGQRASHDEGDTSPDAPPGVFWMPTTGIHTVGLTATDSGLSGLNDIPGTIINNLLSGSGSQTVDVYNDPPVVRDMNAASTRNLTNSYSSAALQYLTLNGETPRADPLSESIEPFASQRNPVHIGVPANISLNVTDPNIEDMQYKDYLHYRYIWGDGYETNWLNSTPTQDELITSTELLWNKTSLFPRMNEQMSNKTHRYAAWAGTSRFILNQSVGFTAQVRDPYNAVTAYNDTVFVYDNAPRRPTIVAINTTRRKAGLAPNAFIEKRPIVFRAISYDPDNPSGDPGGDAVWYLYDWGDGTGSTWTTSGNASKTYFPTRWDYVDGSGRKFNIYYVTITAKDNWGLTSSRTIEILIYKNEPPKITINRVEFNGINLVGASPRYFCGYDCQSASRLWYSISPSTIYATIEDPDGDYFDATYDWGMNGVVTGTNQYTFGYAVFRPYDSNPWEWIRKYNFGWNLAWNQYSPGTYNIVVTAVDEWGADSSASTTATAYPPINAVGAGIFMPDMSDYSRYDTGGFYTEQYSCGFSCYYLTGYAEDHYRAAVSARVSGPFGSSSGTYYAVEVTDNLGGFHSGIIRGTNGGAIRSYVGGMLGVPVS